ncbi:hypothetical protein IWC96_12490 [Brevundimonas sp. BAL450]|jgi:hypothetical protein|uniref:Spore coat protein U domain-containing protein n=1 Tax=Brevundimonas abyssalis TAR-001 TaxID=1391729 RepID=A0A8E0NC07_9CAUL|nr:MULTISPECIES: hypothetical protein [Brevundimonas]MBG7616089.1 hypothetical protein [Brevundimonas sp. BAL450]GAD59580.1 hypothetical protein MBEBAB_1830 [Brevundimonas abyssalis TAR-001]
MIAMAATIILASAAVAPAPGCSGYALTVSQETGHEYNPGAAVDERMSLRLSSAAGVLDAACVAVPVVIAPAPAESLPIRLTNGSSQLGTDVAASSVAVRSGRSLVLSESARNDLVAGRAVVVPLGDVRSGQFRRSGVYQAQIDVTAGDTTQPLTLASRVMPVMRFEASSRNGVENIDLGDLSRGSRTTATFFYRTNADMAVTATSDNGGMLVHEDGPALGSIPYRAFLAGSELDTATGAASVDLPFSRLSVQAQTLEVRVAPATNVYAGRYRDTLTLSFIPY